MTISCGAGVFLSIACIAIQYHILDILVFGMHRTLVMFGELMFC